MPAPTRSRLALALAVFALAATPAAADGPADNAATNVRPIPRPGIELTDDDRAGLTSGLAELTRAIEAIDAADPAKARHLPDVLVFRKAVADALTHNEFFDRKDLGKAARLLELGNERAAALARGETPWLAQTGLVVRGYRSKIDGSIQPYGLVVPERYRPGGPAGWRLDVWFHGRGELLSEVNFLDERTRQRGTFAPPDALVLHPYGRFCNAFKFAGEVDVMEAIDAVTADYPVDDDRVSVRGFSMGGAACWQFAVHYPDRWFAANPGAGFAETRRFLETFQKERLEPTEFERALWNLYDCDVVAANLRHVPTIAYSGELDRQKQAADVMAEALRAEGIELAHLIGPKTAHAYHRETAAEVERRMASLARRGRERTPRSLTFETFTLRYNRMHWLTIDGLKEHWAKARVDARVDGDGRLRIRTSNVAALTVDFPAGEAPFDPRLPVGWEIDGVPGSGPQPLSDGSWRLRFALGDGRWAVGDPPAGLRKRHGLQGPVDDAFMDAFAFVRPTGTARHPKVGAWVESESRRAVERWRRQFRGDAQVVDDAAVDDALIASSHLVLWGDPSSNAVLARIADRLPIRWEADRIVVGDRNYSAEDHALICVYPNPLNPDRYVVLNSGFTYREYDDLNNARQVPKLPDWAIVDLDTPPDARRPGRIAAAEFFGERWELKGTPSD